MKYYIALDVGGTNIKAGIVDQSGCLVNYIIKTYDAKAKESKEIILSNLITIIKNQIYSIPSEDFTIAGVGIGFPGPFDYKKGISFISGLNKYECLFGINIKDELLNYIYLDKFFENKLDSNFSILFENDANLYALGEHFSGMGKSYYKSMYICLGTGIGSAFIENNHLVRIRDDVPKNGWIYDVPFKSSIVDDYISARGIIRLGKDIIGNNFTASVKELSEAAFSGDLAARKVFDTFGTFMGEALFPYIKSFNPQVIILGGQISKSSDLFKTAFKSSIIPFTTDLKVSENSSISTLIGIYNLFNTI